MKEYSLFSLDCGNAQVKGVGDKNECNFPHALVKMSQADVDSIHSHSDTPNQLVYEVNGIHYAIGKQALRIGAGAVKLGEARYVPEYYGVLAAIAMFNVFDEDRRDIFLYGSHTPKDDIYRQDLIDSVKSERWVVTSNGRTKMFRVIEARAFDETTGLFRYITLDDGNPTRFRPNTQKLRFKQTAILDIGGFTFAISIADKSVIDYTSSASFPDAGILDVLNTMAKGIRARYRDKLKGSNALEDIRLRAALRTGTYDAGGLGLLNVKQEADEACNLLLNRILNIFNNFGGSAAFDAVLLGGGGSVPMEERIRAALNHKSIFAAEEDRKMAHMATARGGMKMLNLLQSKGKL